MFDFVRKHTKVMQFVLFLLVFPSFVLFGMEGYSRFNEKGATVARVDGRDIGQGTWDEAHKAETDRLRQTMPNIDPKLLDSPEAKYATLERLVRDRVLNAAVFKFNLLASDQKLQRDLQSNETIASLRRPDGTIDLERYKQLVGAQGLTPEAFEGRVRMDLSTRQVLAGVVGTGFAIPAVADRALGAYFERREVQVLRLNTADFASRIKLDDAELEVFWKDNPQLFQAPEQADVEYLVLDVEGLKKGVTVSEADLRGYYDQNASRLAAKEERRASHILIAAPKSAPAAERDKARARAAELLAQVRKAPDSFADVARKNSQDPGSAPQGGDLDYFARGAMVKPFEDAAFALKKGDISDVVETEFGYHVIRLTDIRSPKQRTYEEMKGEIEAELRKQLAQRRFTEVADAFINGVYEQPDTLKGVAERLKLEVRTASNVTRTPVPGAPGALVNARLLTALFSPESVDKKRNTEAVEIGANALASARIVKYTPARTLPFAEVRDRVRERLLVVRAAEAARKDGQEKLAALKANAQAVNLPEAVTVSRDQTQRLPAPIIEAALRLDPGALPAVTGVDLGPTGYAVVRVTKVLPRDTSNETTLRQDRQQYTQWWTAAEGLAYYGVLQDRFKAEIRVPKPAPSKPAGQAG